MGSTIEICANKIPLDCYLNRGCNIYFYPDYMKKSGRNYVGNGYQEVYQDLLDFCFRQIENETDAKT